MTYQVLARKWRPQDFSSLIGQQPIVTALRNGLTDGRIAQAYMFSGIRGVGKTTAARLLAKALNCSTGPAGEPCNDCQSCREITAGNSLDVLEIDAATYSKVEQIRELTESLRYGPARDSYKVVILDEIHRLSRQAFDALLKIVEEPPAHLVFIFATTEVEAVPATVLSRCQEHRFRRVSSTELAAYMRGVCQAEQIEASDTALRMIARAGEGSVRDSVALLDQLATFGSNKISDQEAKNLLGGVDATVFHRLLGAILGGVHAEISSIVHQIEEQGWDPHGVYSQFMSYCRDALHLAAGATAEGIDLPPEDTATLAKLARPAGLENLLRLTHLLLSGEPTVRRSEIGGLALEILWLRAAELPKLTRIENLLAGGAPPISSPPPTATISPRDTTTVVQASAKTVPKLSSEPLVKSDSPPAELATEPPSTEATAAPSLPDFKRALGRKRQSLSALFAQVEKLRLHQGCLEIYPAASDSLLSTALERQRNAALVEEVVHELCGAGFEWRLVTGPAITAPVKAEATQTTDQHPAVQAVLDIFTDSAIVQPAKSPHSEDT